MYYGNLILGRDGNFYGTSYSGGSNGSGALFKITPAGAFTLLHSFKSGVTTDGYNPYSGVIQASDGNLYGMAYNGGANSSGGILYGISPTGTNYTLVHSFNTFTSDGKYPIGGLVQGSDGLLYGTTTQGGALYGVVFSSNLAGTTFTILHNFGTGSDGKVPYGSLVQGTDGNFYGVTNAGGSSSGGVVFSINSSGSTYNLLHTFTGTATDGKSPQDGLIQGSDGYFYGATQQGGPNPCSSLTCGVVYKIGASGGNTFSLFHSFTLTDGQFPEGTLLLGSDGNYYGTTKLGGANSVGTIFNITPSGTFNLVHTATTSTGDGNTLYNGLVQGSDGNFYIDSNAGGTSNAGAVLKVAPTPTFAAPVTLTVPATVTHGTTFTLRYAVSNAYSTTLQTCTAFNSGPQADWTGAKTGAPAVTNVTLTAPATAGTYTYGLQCGGQQTGFATLTVQ